MAAASLFAATSSTAIAADASPWDDDLQSAARLIAARAHNESGGRVFRAGNELFAENSWIQVMLGQGIMPQTHHQTADLMGDEELAHFLGSIKSHVDKTVMQLPSHQAYVERYCSSTALRAAAA